MDYTKLTKQEKFLILNLTELAMGGSEKAKQQLEDILNREVGGLGSLYEIMSSVHKSLTPSEAAEDLHLTQSRALGPVLLKPKTPQDTWQKKVGLVSKSYKLETEVIDMFAKACEKAEISQAKQLTKMMNEFIKENKLDE